MAMNSVFTIKPYYWEGVWVFDDDRVGLVREPFVAGADKMIDVAVERFGIEDARNGFLMVFSANQFPTANVHLDWERAELAGNVYSWAETETEGGFVRPCSCTSRRLHRSCLWRLRRGARTRRRGSDDVCPSSWK